MCPDLYKGLKLKPEDLERYYSPLMGFDGRMVVPRGMIRLPVQVGVEEVQVDFIVVEAFSPYTAILARPQLHAMGAVSSTLHLKVKYPTQGRVGELMGSQATARQCLVSSITQQPSDPTMVMKDPALQQLKGLAGGNRSRHRYLEPFQLRTCLQKQTLNENIFVDIDIF